MDYFLAYKISFTLFSSTEKFWGNFLLSQITNTKYLSLPCFLLCSSDLALSKYLLGKQMTRIVETVKAAFVNHSTDDRLILSPSQSLCSSHSLHVRKQVILPESCILIMR